jgi:hypothetical protein
MTMLRRAFLAAFLIALCGSAHAANIAFSGAADLGNASGPISTTYTVGTGQNRILVLCAVDETSHAHTATYGGVSLTGPVAVDANQAQELWYVLNPASGSNTLSFTDTISGSSFNQVIVADYYNVKQTGQPDGTGIADDTSANDTFSGGYTTTQAGATVIACASNGGNGTAPTVGGVNFTLRTYAAQFGDTLLADHGSKAPAGGVTLTATIHNGGFKQGQSFLSLIPVPGGGSLMMTGVGN